MSEGVVSDLVTFVVNALGNAGIFFRFDADEEERCLHALLLQYVEDLRRPLRVGTIIEGEGDLVWRTAVHIDLVRRRQVLEDLVANQVVGINRDLPLAGSWTRVNAQ